MFREVSIPEGCTGRLLLHSMPGRYEDFDEFVLEATRQGIERVIRLTPLEEVKRKSPRYAQALEQGKLTWAEELCEVEDFAVPKDKHLFLDIVRSTAAAIRSGTCVLVHCGAGKGRTGMFAVSVLIALGLDMGDAVEQIRSKFSEPETNEQWEIVKWVASQYER